MGKNHITKSQTTKSVSVSAAAFGCLFAFTIVAGTILMNTRVSADDPASTSASANASVNVSAACTMTSSPTAGGNTYSATVSNGNSTELGTTTIKSVCNDPLGYSIYAIGFSSNEYGNNKMISSNGSNDIATGTSGTNSWWAMKIGTSGSSYVPTILNSFNNWHIVPDTYTQVAKYTSATDGGSSAVGSSITANYKVNISSSQPAGTYTGKVKYTLVHPSSNVSTAGSLWTTVASMSKGKQSAAALQDTIVTPTAETPVSTNSGVYEYNATEFGTASDATNTYPIYYYRGILDSYNNMGATYGSSGLADAYPNYVVLSSASNNSNLASTDTCWRIVRTTGSGGVKMVYAGLYGATTAGSCANAQTKAQVTTKAINATANIGNKNIIAVGYTFDATKKNLTEDTAYSTLFGSNTNYSGNTTDSTMKDYIENTWFTNISAYQSLLETSAGYCNDRSLYTASSDPAPVADNFSISTPYTTASSGITAYYFGARVRNMSAYQSPSLTCPRNNADLYTVNGASTGNGQLSKPAALLTADEMSFAGSGSSTAANGSTYNAKSYLRSGSNFWLLSPNNRSANGLAGGLILDTNGNLNRLQRLGRAWGPARHFPHLWNDHCRWLWHCH